MIYVFMESAKYEFSLFPLNYFFNRYLFGFYPVPKVKYSIPSNIQSLLGIFKGNLLTYTNVSISQILIKPSALICDSCFELKVLKNRKHRI